MLSEAEESLEFVSLEKGEENEKELVTDLFSNLVFSFFR